MLQYRRSRPLKRALVSSGVRWATRSAQTHWCGLTISYYAARASPWRGHHEDRIAGGAERAAQIYRLSACRGGIPAFVSRRSFEAVWHPQVGGSSYIVPATEPD